MVCLVEESLEGVGCQVAEREFKVGQTTLESFDVGFLFAFKDRSLDEISVLYLLHGDFLGAESSTLLEFPWIE